MTGHAIHYNCRRDVEDAAGSGTQVTAPVAGQLYRVAADADVDLLTAGTVTFYDNGQCIASAPGPSNTAHTGIRYFSFTYWVPTTAGTHTLTATRDGRTATTTVTVAPAPAGSTPAQPPNQPGCGGGGSLDLGSANLLPGSSGL